MSHGLSTTEVTALLARFGPNEISEKKKNPIVVFLRWLISPITLMLLAAAILSAFFGKFFDAGFIGFLVALNYGIERWQEHKVDNALEKLKSHLTVQASVYRDDVWQMIDSRKLVPGDLVRLFQGAVVPADATIEHVDSLNVNQSMVTGESLPVSKQKDDELYSGSFVVSGEAQIRITKTGAETYFGQALGLVDERKKVSLLEKDILLIAHFLMTVSIAAVVILSGYFLWSGFSLSKLALLDLSLLIAGIPIALPTVMTLILHVGALELAKKQVVVRRLSALDDLANVSLLLTDKTGTLTKNEIIVQSIIPWNDHSANDVLKYALVTDNTNQANPISGAIVKKSKELGIAIAGLIISNYIPADSERKRAAATFQENEKMYTVVNGAPQVILSLCKFSDSEKLQFEKIVQGAADAGFRVLAIAVAAGDMEKNMEMIGLLTLTDPLVDDAKEIISFLEMHGISVKMQTGDNHAIAAYVAKELSLRGAVVGRESIAKLVADKDFLDSIAAFSEILPADKLTIVKGAEKSHVTAVTGDGVNDIPAIKAADIGIAVHNAVDALKSAADVVLLSTGIGVIRDALIEARKVFMRMYSYSVYRISESFRLIVTVFVLGIIIHTYPLTPIQLILIAFLNDIPIISLAFNRVKYTIRPQSVPVRKRFVMSLLFGMTGIIQSLLLFWILKRWGVSIDIIQTAFFLKLIISGHMLVFIAHTEERWWRFLPARPVIIATVATSIIASCFAYFGIFMTKLPTALLGIVWGWALLWMQVAEGVKVVKGFFDARKNNRQPFVSAEQSALVSH